MQEPSLPPAEVEPPADEPITPRGDLTDAACWIALGIAILVGSITMDRLEQQHINPYTVPGLLPGLLGIMMILLGGILAVRSLRRGALHLAPPPPSAHDRERLAPHLGGPRAVPWLRRRADRPRPAVLAGVDDLRHRLDPDHPAHEPRSGGAAQAPRAWAKALAIGLDRASSSPTRVPGVLPGAPALTHLDGTMLQGLADLGHAYLGFLNPLTLAYGLGGAFVGIVIGILPGLSATLAIALLTTLTIKLRAQRRDPGADLLVRRRAVRRLAHGDPAQHPRHRGQRRLLRRRLRAGEEGPGRPGDRHRDLRRLRQHAVRRALPGDLHAGCWPRWRCRSAPSSSSGWRCSASRCRAASSARTRSRAG